MDLLRDWEREIVKSINLNFNAETITKNQQTLYDMLSSIEGLQQSVNQYIPIKTDLNADLHSLLNTLDSHVNALISMKGATPE